jgi:signal transduction histidine kinase/DNA-binding response OmpR family regulator
MKILVVDDLEGARLITTKLLKHLGHEVESAGSGLEALKIIKESRPDLIISDIMMPVMDGFELCRTIKTDDAMRSIPVVLFSGNYTDEEDQRLAYAMGASRVILKPTGIKDFNNLISEIVQELEDKKLPLPDSPQANLHELGHSQSKILARKLDEKLQELKEVNKNLTEALNKAEEEKAKRLSIIAAIGDGISIQDTNYKIIYQNQVQKELMGDHVGEYCYQAYELNNQVCDDCPLEQSFKDGRVHITERMPQGRKGELQIEVTASPVIGSSGKIIMGVEVIRDITERKRIEHELAKTHAYLEKEMAKRTAELQQAHRQLLHAEKLSAIGRLSASIAHEFNNPLYGVMNVLSGLQKRGGLRGEQAELTELAVKECLRMKKLLENLHDFNRPTSGVKTYVDLNKLILETLTFYKKELNLAKINLTKQLSKNLPKIYGVEDQIKQVFLNLISNACDACKSEDVVTISTDQEGEYIIIRVQDTGKGIPPENLPKIFEPFFSTKPEVKGTGLGLSVSYGIIKNHGGRIDVTSEPGLGTTFTVSLPTHSQTP